MQRCQRLSKKNDVEANHKAFASGAIEFDHQDALVGRRPDNHEVQLHAQLHAQLHDAELRVLHIQQQLASDIRVDAVVAFKTSLLLQ